MIITPIYKGYSTFTNKGGTGDKWETEDLVPPGYWDSLTEAMRHLPKLPDQDKSNDPEPLV